MSVSLAPGTEQYLTVAIIDETNTVTDLEASASSPNFDVLDDADAFKYTAASATLAGMSVRCLVDTSAWALGRYRLFVRFTVGAETPRLGPFEFYLVDDPQAI
jgi:hypothetical protein